MLSKLNLSSKLTLAALLILLIFLGDLKYKQWQSKRQIEQQMNSLQEQTNALQKKNTELNQSLQYINTQEFKEGIARQQLDLKKQGEVVYGFSDPSSQSSTQNSSSAKTDSNFKKWWAYFFSN